MFIFVKTIIYVMKNIKRQTGGRGIGVTVKELMESTRLKLAVKHFDDDPMMLRAILTELSLEVFSATKSALTRIVGKAYGGGWTNEDGEVVGRGLDSFEMKAYLRSLDVDLVNNMNIYWGLSDAERELYSADPRFEMPPAKRKALFERVMKRFNMK